MFPKQALMLAKKITDTYFVLPQEWAAFIQTYLEKMTGGSIDIKDIQGKSLGFAQREMMQMIGRQFLEPMLGLIMPTGKLTPEKGMHAAQRFIATNLQFQMSAWMLHLLGDIQSFGMFKSLKDLPNAIAWTYGIGWLSWIAMGPMFRAGIAAPLEQLLNRTYRPVIPTQSQLIDMLQQGLLDKTDFLEYMGRLGFEDDFTWALVSIASKDYSRSELEDFYYMGILSHEQVESWYKRRGYESSKARLLTDLLINKRKLKLTEDIAGTAIRLYEKKKINVGVLRQYLEQANYSQDEQDLTIVNAELKQLL